MAEVDPIPVLQAWQEGYPNNPTPIINGPAQTVVQRNQTGAGGNPGDGNIHAYYIDVQFFAQPNQWQDSPATLHPDESTAITASGQWQIIGGNENGPGGYQGIPGYGPDPYLPPGMEPRGGYLVPGAIEGCLLVKNGAGNI